MKTKYLQLSEHNFLLIFLVLRALQRDDLSLYRLASSCIFDIMQFRQHYAHDKQNAKPKVFVEINGPLSFVHFNAIQGVSKNWTNRKSLSNLQSG